MADRQPDMLGEPVAEYGELESDRTSIRRHREIGSRATTKPVPAAATRSALERLIASGRIRPARGDLLSLGYPPDEPHDISISEALKEQRSER